MTIQQLARDLEIATVSRDHQWCIATASLKPWIGTSRQKFQSKIGIFTANRLKKRSRAVVVPALIFSPDSKICLAFSMSPL
jgi:hypothetical protein